MITFDEPVIGKEEKSMLYEAIEKSSIAQGYYVSRFEHEFSSYCGTKYASASFNGTTALHLALASLGISQGDEVIVPSFTFIATSNVVRLCGAKPVFADIDKKTLCIDPTDIKKRIGKKTKAIIPVHIFGYPCDMEGVKEIAEKHGLYIVEDAAEAHGAVYKGKKVGSLSDIGCFSFHHSKIARTGEGGMCTTDNSELDEKIKLLRSQGKVKNELLKGDDFIEKRYCHQLFGFNYRMLDLQGAIGIAQTKKIEENIKIRRQCADLYKKEFEKYDVSIPEINKNAEPSYWVYPLIFSSRKIKLRVGRELVKRGIPFLPFFWPCHKQLFYSTKDSLPMTDFVFERGLVLPCNPLLTKQEIIETAALIGKTIKNA